MSWTAANVKIRFQRQDALIREDRRLKVREMASNFEILKTTIHTLVDDLLAIEMFQ